MKLKPKSNFLMLQNLIIERYLRELGFSSFCLLLALFFLAGRFGDRFYQGDAEIKRKFGISESTINRARKKLKKMGFIDYKSGFKTTRASKATTYMMIPRNKLRSELRITNHSKRSPPNSSI